MMKKILLIALCTITSLCLLITPVCADQSDGYTHVITKGETFWSIAKQYNISMSELQKVNQTLEDISLIYPGQTIYIPNIDILSSVEHSALRQINKYRAKKGLADIKSSSTLSSAARKKASDMVEYQYFAHQSPTYGSPFTMILDCGLDFSAAGENIARGQKSADEVVTDWIESKGNCANILSDIYTTAGIGGAKTADGTYYFCLLLIKQI